MLPCWFPPKYFNWRLGKKNFSFWQQACWLHSGKRVGTLLRKGLFTLSASLRRGATFLNRPSFFFLACFEENCLFEVRRFTAQVLELILQSRASTGRRIRKAPLVCRQPPKPLSRSPCLTPANRRGRRHQTRLSLF